MLSRTGRMGAAIIGLIGLVVAGCSISVDGNNQAAAATGTSGDAEWHNFGGDGNEQHYAATDQINRETVGRLRLAWHYDVEPGFSASTPIMANGRVFITTGNSHIRALDAATGRLIWDYDSRTREIVSDSLHMGWGNKGIAYANGRIFLATTDGRVIALNADNGQAVWEQREFPLEEARYINGAPRVFNGMVIVGNGGADITPARGFVTAYDAATGERKWRFYTVPDFAQPQARDRAEEVMNPTWRGTRPGQGGGGTVWNAMSYDAQSNLLYLGVGNGFPYNQDLRSPGGGDNLFLASIVAVDLTTGQYRWHYQTCPAEQWDCTATMDMTLADLTINGQQRRVLMQAPKNGFFYVLDARTGQFISAQPFSRVTWAERIDQQTGRPVMNPRMRYQDHDGMFEMWPGPQGAHSWTPQAFSPRTGLVYIPVMEVGAMIGRLPPNSPPSFMSRMGVMMIPDPENLAGQRRSFLRAWDPINQRAAWTVPLPGAWPGGVLATGGDLVFQGRMDSQFVAYDARDGRQLWAFASQAPIVGAPISYTVAGRQYVTVITGNSSQGAGILATGNAAFRTDYNLPRRVLTFALDGGDALPAFTPPPLVPAVEQGFVPNQQQAMAGFMAYSTSACLVCHGSNAIGGGAAPDLRYSQAILNAAGFKSIVQGGALVSNGMPRFPQIPDATLESIRYYLRARALQTAAEQAGGQRPAGGNAPSSGH